MALRTVNMERVGLLNAIHAVRWTQSKITVSMGMPYPITAGTIVVQDVIVGRIHR